MQHPSALHRKSVTQRVIQRVVQMCMALLLLSPLAGWAQQCSSSGFGIAFGTVYINEAKAALEHGAISLPQFEMLAVAINTGTNLPSVATPNGQAAFLFLLTSALAPLIRLSYGRMVWMALPYTIVLTLVGLLCVEFTLMPVTDWLLAHGWLVTPTLP